MDYLNNVMNFLSSLFGGGTIFNIITFVIAILSVITTIYFYRKSQRLLLITYTVRTIQVIKEGADKLKTLKIIYKDSSIPTFTISKIAIWNDGRDSIDRDNIASKNPIRIKIDEKYEILEAEILYKKNESNDFKIKIDQYKKIIDVDFEYFDINEGIVLQIYHTGKNSRDINIEGQIKSGKKINRIKPYVTPIPFIDLLPAKTHANKTVKRRSYYRTRIIMGWVLVVISISLIVIGLEKIWFEEEIIKPIERHPYWGTFTVLLVAFMYGYMGYSMIKRRIPKGFDIFNEEFNSDNEPNNTSVNPSEKEIRGN